MFRSSLAEIVRGRRLVAALVVPVGVLALFVLHVAASPSTPVLGVGTAAAAELTAVDLGTLGGATSKAVALNGLGQVAGDSETAGGATHAFRWAKGRMKDLGTLVVGTVTLLPSTPPGTSRATPRPALGRGGPCCGQSVAL